MLKIIEVARAEEAKGDLRFSQAVSAAVAPMICGREGKNYSDKWERSLLKIIER